MARVGQRLRPSFDDTVVTGRPVLVTPALGRRRGGRCLGCLWLRACACGYGNGQKRPGYQRDCYVESRTHRLGPSLAHFECVGTLSLCYREVNCFVLPEGEVESPVESE